LFPPLFPGVDSDPMICVDFQPFIFSFQQKLRIRQKSGKKSRRHDIQDNDICHNDIKNINGLLNRKSEHLHSFK
jgi:hypothetical protein